MSIFKKSVKQLLQEAVANLLSYSKQTEYIHISQVELAPHTMGLAREYKLVVTFQIKTG